MIRFYFHPAPRVPPLHCHAADRMRLQRLHTILATGGF
jgi:hypothetical protein